MKNQSTHISAPFTLRVARAISIMLALSIMTPLSYLDQRVYGYASDVDRFQHSTFHRDLTRVLAHGVGITDADKLAVITEAVDSGGYTHYGFGMCLTYTKRIDPVNTQMESAFYYHWARRSGLSGFGYPSLTADLFPAGSYANTSVAWNENTCLHFNSTNANGKKSDFLCTSGAYDVPCKSRGEADTLRMWAIEHNQSAMTAEGGPKLVPQYAELRTRSCPQPSDTEAGYKTVDVSKTDGLDRLVALGIFIHALGDSYSHEYCMGESCTMGVCIRTHPAPTCKNIPESGSCGGPWHFKKEFGTGPASKVTEQAGRAIWKALKEYCDAGGKCGKRVWNDENAEAFIHHFVIDTCSGDERVAYANYVLKNMMGYESYNFQSCSSEERRKSGSRRRRGRASSNQAHARQARTRRPLKSL